MIIVKCDGRASSPFSLTIGITFTFVVFRWQ